MGVEDFQDGEVGAGYYGAGITMHVYFGGGVGLQKEFQDFWVSILDSCPEQGASIGWA